MNRKKLLEILGCTSTGAGLHQWYVMMKGKNSEQNLHQEVTESLNIARESLDKLNVVEAKINTIVNREEVTEQLTEGLNHMTKVKDILTENTIENLNKDPEKLLIIKDNVNKGSDIIKAVIDKYSNKFWDGNNDIFEKIFSMKNEYFDYINTLSLFDAAMIFHIILLISIVISTFNVLTLLFGDYLINLLQLDKKFPKLAKLLIIRRKAMNMSIFFSLSYIILISIGFIYTDIYALLK